MSYPAPTLAERRRALLLQAALRYAVIRVERAREPEVLVQELDGVFYVRTPDVAHPLTRTGYVVRMGRDSVHIEEV